MAQGAAKAYFHGGEGSEYKKLIPIMWRGVHMPHYYIDTVSGRIFSTKNSSWPQPLSMPTKGKAKYPKVLFKVDGKDYSAQIHQVIAENIIPFPRPKTITKKTWDSTCDTVKHLLMLLHLVNHKDHNKYNWDPSNLEWVTPAGNANAYQAFIGNR
jgi:HNH endonuclease